MALSVTAMPFAEACAAGCSMVVVVIIFFAHLAPAAKAEKGMARQDGTTEVVPFPKRRYFASTATGFAVSCFFFQSPIAARMASSASTEQ
jgi:hypothetical protein